MKKRRGRNNFAPFLSDYFFNNCDIIIIKIMLTDSFRFFGPWVLFFKIYLLALFGDRRIL